MEKCLSWQQICIVWGELNGLVICHSLDISFCMKRLRRDFGTVGLRFEEGIDACAL